MHRRVRAENCGQALGKDAILLNAALHLGGQLIPEAGAFLVVMPDRFAEFVFRAG